ncbi:hypothetical protein BGZ93_008235 [Podila epicladia]|nr:hypothetical protein BGZ92_003657 [Podila epicladia]KAG0099290.1 hypothetical protein BGZ93_008235 [Podila epicladia]
MQTNEHTDISQDDEGFYYEVSQEQLDAVDRMLAELDLDEQFDRVPAAFRIVDQNQYTHFHDGASPLMAQPQGNGAAGSNHNPSQDQHALLDSDDDMDGQRQFNDSDPEDDDRAAFGYIPLDQGDFMQMNDDDDEEEDEGEVANGENGFHSYNQMDSDPEDNNLRDDGNEDDDGEGYDGYLETRNADGTVATIVPVLPSAVAIYTAELDPAGVEPISEDDLKTISQVMSSFSLPAPEWARSIPEDRWLPKIVQQAEAEASNQETSEPLNE